MMTPHFRADRRHFLAIASGGLAAGVATSAWAAGAAKAPTSTVPTRSSVLVLEPVIAKVSLAPEGTTEPPSGARIAPKRWRSRPGMPDPRSSRLAFRARMAFLCR